MTPPEDDRREAQDARPEAVIETAIDASQAQLDQLKAQARAFLGSQADAIDTAFYDDMNGMAQRLGMLKALITAEEETRKRNPARTAARGSALAVRDALRDTDSD